MPNLKLKGKKLIKHYIIKFLNNVVQLVLISRIQMSNF